MTGRVRAPGTVLSGRYRISEVIGESDLSTVYAATDILGASPVALKVFDPSLMSRGAALSEYQNQARQAAALGTEAIARVYDFGIDANSSLPFSTAEHIAWPSLDRRVLVEGPLAVADLARALTVLGRALDAAHAAGLTHRDLKPQNLFISSTNPEWSRITDFGVSAVRRFAPASLGWGGPPGYTPIEAVDAGAPGHPGSDLFALGVIAFFALTRVTPFRSLRGPAFDAHAHWAELNQPLGSASERAKDTGVLLDPALDAWFAKALARTPHERFPSASAMTTEFAVLSDRIRARGAGGTRVMPGIAAAIAQPLVFQPEPARTPAVEAPAVAQTPATDAQSFAGEEPLASIPKKRQLLPFLLGGGVLLCGGLAAAGYGLTRKASEASSGAGGSSGASTASVTAPTAPKPAAVPSVDAPATPTMAEATPSSSSVNVAARGSATAAATPSVASTVATKPDAATAVTAKPAVGTKSASTPSAKASTPKAPAKASGTATAKPSNTAIAKPSNTAIAKPAASPKPAASAKLKKKCSTFLGCK